MLGGLIDTGNGSSARGLQQEQIPLSYDYEQVAAEHRAIVQAAAIDIKRRERRAALDIVEIGRALQDVQARLEHGQFLPWIEQEFGWQKSMAYNFMAVAEKFPKFGNLEQFGLSALYLLSGPSVPEQAITEANQLADQGERVTHKAAKAIVDKHRPQSQPEQKYVDVWELGQGLWRWVRENNATIDMLEDLRNLDASQYWPAASEAMPGPRRKSDVKQAINNVIDQFRRRAGHLAAQARPVEATTPPTTGLAAMEADLKAAQAKADVKQWVESPPAAQAQPKPKPSPVTDLATCSHRGQIFIQAATKGPSVRAANVLLCEECGLMTVEIEVSFQRHAFGFRLDSERAVEAAGKWMAQFEEVSE